MKLLISLILLILIAPIVSATTYEVDFNIDGNCERSYLVDKINNVDNEFDYLESTPNTQNDEKLSTDIDYPENTITANTTVLPTESESNKTFLLLTLFFITSIFALKYYKKSNKKIDLNEI